MFATLDTLTALVLGLIQGLTEFLPVSSSGHIAIGERFFGLHDAPLALSIVLHAGTLLATLYGFRRELGELARDLLRYGRGEGQGQKGQEGRTLMQSDSGKLLAAVVVATIPTAVIGLLLKGPVEAYSHNSSVVAACLMGSACVVLATRFGKGDAELPSLGVAFLIGVAQGIAVLPGLTRSGSTIAAAMLCGLSGIAAFRFSFLISLPAIGGAMLLELRHPEALGSLGWPAAFGGLVALLSGYVCLVLLRGVVHRGNLWVFALYLVPVSLLLFFW